MGATLVEVLGAAEPLPPLPRDADPPAGSSARRRRPERVADLVLRAAAARHARPDRALPREIEDRCARARGHPRRRHVQRQRRPPDELRIAFDLARAAALGIPIPDIAASRRSANDVSGGSSSSAAPVHAALHRPLRAGRSRRAGARLARRPAGAARRRRDRRGRARRTAALRVPERQPGHRPADPATSGANVLATLNEVQDGDRRSCARARWPRGLGIEQSFDASLFINRRHRPADREPGRGRAARAGLLWWFLRDCRATFLIATAIPICAARDVLVLQARRAQPQRDLARRPRVRGRHGDGRRDRRAREHRPARSRGMTPGQAALDGTRQVLPRCSPRR